MAIQGTYDGFNILDISNPANQATSDDVDKRLFFLDSPTGAGLGSWTLPRPQTATENCTIHNYNVVPSNKGYLLVSGKYQSGISVLDFTHPANAVDGEEPDVPISGGRGFSRVLFSGPLQIPTGGLHLLLINNDGTRAFYALLTDGLGVADVSDFAAGVEDPEPRIITVNVNRPTWQGSGTHGAVKLWNHDWVYVSDEVYGSATASSHGCPWGWPG